MFWIIGDQATMTKETEADLNRLGPNGHVSNNLARTVFDSTLAQVQALLNPGVKAGEPIFVLAHADYEKGQPWIGGLFFGDFTTAMASKFTVAGLSNRTLWLLVCHVGRDILDFASKLSALGVRNTTIYIPKDFMYISTKGIPHTLVNQKDVRAADKQVRKYGCEYMKITNSQETGVGWAGATIDANGTVTALGATVVEQAVQAQFDPDLEGEID